MNHHVHIEFTTTSFNFSSSSHSQFTATRIPKLHSLDLFFISLGSWWMLSSPLATHHSSTSSYCPIRKSENDEEPTPSWILWRDEQLRKVLKIDWIISPELTGCFSCLGEGELKSWELKNGYYHAQMCPTHDVTCLVYLNIRFKQKFRCRITSLHHHHSSSLEGVRWGLLALSLVHIFCEFGLPSLRGFVV